MIDTPQHNVVDARTTLFSCFSWHNYSNNGAKISNNPQTTKKKYTKGTVPFVYLPIDESCRNAVQTCNISYDEDLYYNPNANPYTLMYEHQKVGKKHKMLQMV